MTLPRVLFLILLAIAGVSGPGVAQGRNLTDAQKLTKVYDMYNDYRKEFPEVADISPKDAMALLAQGKAVFVDTRSAAEIAVSKIPGAVTGKDFLKSPERYADKTIIVYCTISYRSGLFARKLAKQGIEATNLKGGILAWTLEGGKVVDSHGKTVHRIHVYGEKWNYPPDGYKAVTFGRLDRLLSRRPRQMLPAIDPLPDIVSPEAKLS
jgi:sodium/bile acid cotransporter 7